MQRAPVLLPFGEVPSLACHAAPLRLAGAVSARSILAVLAAVERAGAVVVAEAAATALRMAGGAVGDTWTRWVRGGAVLVGVRP